MSPNPAYLVSFCRKEIRVDRQTGRLHRQTDRQAGCTHRGNAMWGHGKKTVICKPGRETPGETQPADTLVLDFQPLELWEIKFLLLKPEIRSFFPPGSLSRLVEWPWSHMLNLLVYLFSGSLSDHVDGSLTSTLLTPKHCFVLSLCESHSYTRGPIVRAVDTPPHFVEVVSSWAGFGWRGRNWNKHGPGWRRSSGPRGPLPLPGRCLGISFDSPSASG